MKLCTQTLFGAYYRKQPHPKHGVSVNLMLHALSLALGPDALLPVDSDIRNKTTIGNRVTNDLRKIVRGKLKDGGNF